INYTCVLTLAVYNSCNVQEGQVAALAKTEFFESMERQGLALTYDDVRLATCSGQGRPMPEVIDISSSFSQHVELKVPFVSAAMDTVTDSNMAIAMGKLGGLGVIHAAMSVDEQRREVRRVKKAVNGIVTDPISVYEDD